MISNQIKTITVIGIWHLGIINCVGFAEQGYKVVGIDLDIDKIKNLQQGIPPLYEPGLEDFLKKHIENNTLSFTSNMQIASEAEAVIIAYDTPINDQDEVDITPILSAALKVAPFLQENTPVIITSQVPLGTCENIQDQIRKLNPSWKSGIIYTPENLKLGTAISRFLNPDMLVFGASGSTIHEQALALYAPFNTKKITTDLRTAEMVKHALNTFLATSITFINEIANLSDRLGVDAVAVGQALKFDTRIGKSALMMPGLGFSGGTLARDVVQLKKFADKTKYKANLIDGILSINENTFDEIIIKLQNRLGDLKDKSIGILGLTYKPDTSTMRRSSAIKIIKKLNEAGAKCFGYDPKADDKETEEYDTLFTRISSPMALAQDKDALILITEWPEFKQLDFAALAKTMKVPIFIDSKNYLLPQDLITAGFDYQGFGRSK